MKSKRSVISLAMEDIDNGVELINESSIDPLDLVVKEDELGPVLDSTDLNLATEQLKRAIEELNLLNDCSGLIQDTSLTEGNKNVILSVADAISPVAETGEIATEGFTDKIKDAATKVYHFIVEMIKKFVTYVQNFFSSISRFDKRIQSYQERIKALSVDTYTGEAKLSSSKAPNGFFGDGGAPTDIKKYLNEFDYTNTVIGNAPIAMKALVEIVSKILDHIEYTLKKTMYSPEIAKEVDKLQQALDVGWHSDILRHLDVTVELDKDKGEYRGSTLLGGSYIKSSAPPNVVPESKTYPLDNFVNHLKKFSIEIVKDTELKAQNLDKECGIPTKDEMLEICFLSKNTVTISDTLNSVNNDESIKVLNNVSKKAKLMTLFKRDMPTGYLHQTNADVSILIPISKLVVSLSSMVTPVLFDTLRGAVFVLETSLKEYEHSNAADPNALKLGYSK